MWWNGTYAQCLWWVDKNGTTFRIDGIDLDSMVVSRSAKLSVDVDEYIAIPQELA